MARYAQVETGEGHIDHHQGMLYGPTHHFGVVDHFLQRDRQGVGVPLDDHAQGVAHQDAFDFSRIQQLARGKS